MVAVPGATPVTIPDEAPTVAIPVLPLDQVPPEVAFDKVVFPPTQSSIVPEMAVGGGVTFTVTVDGTAQPQTVDVTL